MALQVDSQDQVQEFLGVVSRRRWQILLPALYVITLGVVLSVFAPKRYVAEMSINLLEARVDDRSYDRRSLQESATQREIDNAEYQAKAPYRVRRVIELLGWDDFLALEPTEQTEYIDRVCDRIEVDVLPKAKDEGSTFVDLRFSNVDRQKAEDFLERLATIWVQEVYNKDADNLRQERESIRKLRDESKKEFERLVRERALVISDNELTPGQVEIGSRGREEDPVAARRNVRLVEQENLEIRIEEQSARRQSLQDLISATPVFEISSSVITQGNQDLIRQLEQQMQSLVAKQDRYLQAHTEWQRIQRDLEEAEEQIQELRAAARDVIETSTPAFNPKRRQLQDQIDALTTELDELTAKRNRLADLNEADRRLIDTRIQAMTRVAELDVQIDSAEANLRGAEDELFQRQQALQVLTEAYGQPWIITKEVSTKDQPTEPNTAILIAFAVIAGLALGVGVAAAAEFLQTGFRNPGDAARSIELPVLGVIGEYRTVSERRASSVRRIVVALSTVLLLGGLGGFTWTWANRPELLSTEVLEAIEGVRREFR
jgi:uncharacterized protein involved in exopolysaccharide biosynthesis